MAAIILPFPTATNVRQHYRRDADGDGDGRQPQRRRERDIIVPGEIVTDDAQWMRGHGTFVAGGTTAMRAAVAGQVVKTNKLLSVVARRARYRPEIGDIVVGRIAEVQARRWRVDVAGPLLAALPLASINLPGGALRRRTAVDELAMRLFFAEADLLVAEVRSVFHDGSAELHTRSLRYGKLRNGLFLALAGVGGCHQPVPRSRRHVFTLVGAHAAGDIDVVLGVNGYVWIAKHVEPAAATTTTATTASDDAGAGAGAGKDIYSSQNDAIPAATCREIARLADCLALLAAASLPVDETRLVRAYEAAVDFDAEEQHVGAALGHDGGDRASRIIASVLDTAMEE